METKATVFLLALFVLMTGSSTKKQTTPTDHFAGMYYCAYHLYRIERSFDTEHISFDSIVGYDTLTVGRSDLDFAVTIQDVLCRFFSGGTTGYGPIVPRYSPAVYFFAQDSICYQHHFYSYQGSLFDGGYYIGGLIYSGAQYSKPLR